MVILINLVFRTDKDYYSQMFLEECKYIIKENEMLKYITNDVEVSSDESDKKDTMKKKILMKKIIVKNKLKIFSECLFWESNLYQKKIISIMFKSQPFLKISTKLKEFWIWP